MAKLCIVSHSGGLDSTTLMARAIEDGYLIQPVNFNYGQKNEIEIQAQKNVVNYFKEQYPEKILDTIYLDFNFLFGGIIQNFQKLRDSGEIEKSTDLEYYMPFRNLVFGSISGMIGELLALSMGIDKIDKIDIGIGVHKHSAKNYKKDYWDITPKFIKSLNEIMKLNDSASFGVYAPYAESFKDQIIVDCVDLCVPYKLTWTCYNPVHGEKYVTPCLECEACKERESNGLEVGVIDINDYSLKVIKNGVTLICGETGEIGFLDGSEILNKFKVEEDKQDSELLGNEVRV